MMEIERMKRDLDLKNLKLCFELLVETWKNVFLYSRIFYVYFMFI